MLICKLSDLLLPGFFVITSDPASYDLGVCVCEPAKAPAKEWNCIPVYSELASGSHLMRCFSIFRRYGPVSSHIFFSLRFFVHPKSLP